MRGTVIQSRGPLRYGIVDGINVRDSRVHNYSSSAVTLQDASVQGGLKKEKGRARKYALRAPVPSSACPPTRKGCSNMAIATVYGSSEALLVVEPLLSEARLTLRRRVAAAARSPRSQFPAARCADRQNPAQAGFCFSAALGGTPSNASACGRVPVSHCNGLHDKREA